MINKAIEEIAQLTNDAIQKSADLFEENNKVLDNHLLLAQFFLSKTVTSFYAVWTLCKNGYGQDAFIVLRTIFENLVNLSFVNQEPAKRVPLFIEYDYIKAHKRLEDYESLYPEKSKEERIRQYIIARYEKVKDNYPNKNRWSRISLFDMAKSCELENYYYMVYRLGSVFTHGGSDSTQDYINTNGTHFSIRFGQPNTEKIDLALITACSLVLVTIQETCNVFLLDPPEICHNVLNRIEKAGKNIQF